MMRVRSREKNPGPEPARSPVGAAVSTKSRSPQMTGVAEPSPGSAIFQRTFDDSLHVTGGSPAGATPLCSGPRHSGQNPAASPPDSCPPRNTAVAVSRQTATTPSRATPAPFFSRSIPLHLESWRNRRRRLRLPSQRRPNGDPR